MGLESATFVNDLVSTNPLGTDTKAQGDDHLRLLKQVLLATFKNFTRAFYYPATVAAKTSAYTVLTTDQNTLIPVTCSTADITITLPAGSTLVDGYEVEIIKNDFTDYLVTVDGNGSETINGALTQNLWQSYQTMKLRYSSAASAWFAKREYIPPKGEVTPWGGATTPPDGWLFPNGQTIGDASSGATARANVDCQGLYYHLYNNFSNTICPMSTGRGASAAADWAAHKTLGLPNLAGVTWVGLDNLGGITDRGLLTATANGANTAGQTNGEQIGSESNTLTTAQLASHSHGAGTLVGPLPDHIHPVTGASSLGVTVGGGSGAAPSSTNTGNPTTNPSVAMTSGSTATAGSGTAHANVQPSFVSAWKIKI